MQLYFDSNTLADWKDRSITEIFIQFVNRGCEGTKVRVYEPAEYPEEALQAVEWINSPVRVL